MPKKEADMEEIGEMIEGDDLNTSEDVKAMLDVYAEVVEYVQTLGLPKEFIPSPTEIQKMAVSIAIEREKGKRRQSFGGGSAKASKASDDNEDDGVVVCEICGEEIEQKIGKSGKPYYGCFDCRVFIDEKTGKTTPMKGGKRGR